MKRRRACQVLGLASAGLLGSKERLPAEDETFRLRYILSSAMYGEMPLAEILPTIPEITAAINKSRAYVERCLHAVRAS